MEKIRQFLNTKAGKAISLFVVILALLWAGLSIASAMRGSDEAADSWTRTYVCSETGKAFTTKIEVGWTNPVPSPYSGKNTGWPAEFCGWNKDGSIRSEPFPVLLNIYTNVKGPTFCPDCGRLVKIKNPPAIAGEQPPPTKAEYSKHRSSDGE